jgi:small subunit ribosomal protein S8
MKKASGKERRSNMNADPIADMLTRIRNANALHYDTVSMPYSKMKEEFAKILKEKRAISSMSRSKAKAPKEPQPHLKYGPSWRTCHLGFQENQQAGLTGHRQADKLPRVLRWLGIAIISTSKGLLTDAEARKAKVGGEVICYVW